MDNQLMHSQVVFCCCHQSSLTRQPLYKNYYAGCVEYIQFENHQENMKHLFPPFPPPNIVSFVRLTAPEPSGFIVQRS